MDRQSLNSFFNELEKIASMELLLHGYKRDPDKLLKSHHEWAAKKEEAAGPYPKYKKGFLGRRAFKKGVSVRNVRIKAFEHQNPDPLGDWSKVDEAVNYSEASRVKTPFDRKAHYGKLHSHRLGLSNTAQKMITDHVYADKPITYNIKKRELGRLTQAYERHRGDTHQKEVQAFIDKAKHLAKRKDVKFARLEYS